MLMYSLCGVGMIALRSMKSPAITDYYNVTSNVLNSKRQCDLTLKIIKDLLNEKIKLPAV